MMNNKVCRDLIHSEGNEFEVPGVCEMAATGDPAVCILDFGSDKAASSGDFTVQFPVASAGAAIIRIA